MILFFSNNTAEMLCSHSTSAVKESVVLILILKETENCINERECFIDFDLKRDRKLYLTDYFY